MEKWKPIPGYEGIYDASNRGHIRNTKRQHVLRPRLKKSSGGMKYVNVVLYKNGMARQASIARLVALAWCDGYFDGATVNHKDGNTFNNNAENLEWLTITNNICHAHKSGLCSKDVECNLIDKDGNIHSFNSMISASKFLGRCDRYIYSNIEHNRRIATSKDGSIYKIQGV